MCVFQRSIAGVPLSRALPGYPITAPPPVCVPDVIGALAVWNQNHKKKYDRVMTRNTWVYFEHRVGAN